METFNISVGFADGSEVNIELDVSSLGELSQYSENEMDAELRYLIKHQYPNLGNPVVDIYC